MGWNDQLDRAHVFGTDERVHPLPQGQDAGDCIRHQLLSRLRQHALDLGASPTDVHTGPY
jgi:hypothetical protein